MKKVEIINYGFLGEPKIEFSKVKELMVEQMVQELTSVDCDIFPIIPFVFFRKRMVFTFEREDELRANLKSLKSSDNRSNTNTNEVLERSKRIEDIILKIRSNPKMMKELEEWLKDAKGDSKSRSEKKVSK